jgi:hypothetical protein
MAGKFVRSVCVHIVFPEDSARISPTRPVREALSRGPNLNTRSISRFLLSYKPPSYSGDLGHYLESRRISYYCGKSLFVWGA